MIFKYKYFVGVNEMIKSDSDKEIDKLALSKIRKSFTQIITNFPFFADLLFNLKIYQVPDSFFHPHSPTMATDGLSIGYSTTFVKKLTMPEINFVIIHELMHNANFHFNRAGHRDPELWNISADYSINLLINDMTTTYSNILKSPNDILLDEKYRNMSSEQIYDLLEKSGKGKSGKGKGSGKEGKGSGKSGEGSGSGKSGDGGGSGLPPSDIKKPGSIGKNGKKVYKGGGSEESTNPSDLEKKWKEIIQQAASKNAGTGSASMDRWIKKITKAKINWRRELKRFINNIYNKFDYGYFNKKFIHKGDYLPGLKKIDESSFDNVVIAIDTSGSITQDTLSMFASELYKLFKSYQINKCYVIWCDSSISSVQVFDKIDAGFKLDKLQPKGGGGTSFIPPFDWVEKNLLKHRKIPAFMLYFTDAYGDAPSPSQFGIKNYKDRVMWIITENDDASNIKFGKKIFIDKINP